MSIPVAADQLKSIVQRVERLEAEITTLNSDKSEIYKEARANGFDVKAIKKVVSKRKLDSSEREEQDLIFDTYWDAVHGGGLVHARIRENIEEFPSSTNLAGPRLPAVPGGEPSKPSPDAGSAKMEQDCNPAPGRSDVSVGTHHAQSGQAATSSDSSDAGDDHEVAAEHHPVASAGPLVSIRPATPLRPHCRRPENCGGYGSTHCGTCLRLHVGSKPEEAA